MALESATSLSGILARPSLLRRFQVGTQKPGLTELGLEIRLAKPTTTCSFRPVVITRGLCLHDQDHLADTGKTSVVPRI